MAERWNLLGRAGLDFGDDDGFMAGIGLGYDVNTSLEIRGEVVSRDDIDSLQGELRLPLLSNMGRVSRR